MSSFVNLLWKTYLLLKDRKPIITRLYAMLLNVEFRAYLNNQKLPIIYVPKFGKYLLCYILYRERSNIYTYCTVNFVCIVVDEISI